MWHSKFSQVPICRKVSQIKFPSCDHQCDSCFAIPSFARFRNLKARFRNLKVFRNSSFHGCDIISGFQVTFASFRNAMMGGSSRFARLIMMMMFRPPVTDMLGPSWAITVIARAAAPKWRSGVLATVTWGRRPDRQCRADQPPLSVTVPGLGE